MVFHRPHSGWQKPGKGTEKLQPTTPTSGSYLTHTWVNAQQAGSDTFIIGGAEEETQRGGDRGASQSLEYLLWFFIDRICRLTVYKVTHGQDKQSNKGQTHQALTPTVVTSKSRPGLAGEGKPTKPTAHVLKKSSHPKLPCSVGDRGERVMEIRGTGSRGALTNCHFQ